MTNWTPQEGPQSKLLACPVFEAFYGGARGGGKTDAMLGEYLAHQAEFKEHANGIFIRRSLPELEECIARAREIYLPMGAEWKEGNKIFHFPNGARLKFRYLDRDQDAQKYQGHSYTRVYIEELTNFPSFKPIQKLIATLRSGTGVPCRFRATGNPGGPGHLWVKARYIDPAPGGYSLIKETFISPFDDTVLEQSRVFIPAKLSDNQVLMKNDPNYVARLQQAGSEQLVKAWLEGDWDVAEGAYFDCWDSSKHVCQAFPIPDSWAKFRAADWGSAKPFAVYWFAIAEENFRLPGKKTRILPRGGIIAYREYYGMKPGHPNTGLKLTAEEVARNIKALEWPERMAYAVMDPSAFAQDGGPSIAERMATSHRVSFRRADNARVARGGNMGGWDMLRHRLQGDDDGNPMLVFMDTCPHAIRTLPVMQHDEARPEDLDTTAEDHAADAIRYGCMSRPWTPKHIAKPEDPLRQSTFSEIVRQRARRPQQVDDFYG